MLAEQHADGQGRGVIDLGRLHGCGVVLPQLLLVAEGSESDDGHIHVSVLEGRVDDVRVRGDIKRVEVDQAHLARAGGRDVGHGGVDTRRILARGEGDGGAAAAGGELAHDR